MLHDVAGCGGVVVLRERAQGQCEPVPGGGGLLFQVRRVLHQGSSALNVRTGSVGLESRKRKARMVTAVFCWIFRRWRRLGWFNLLNRRVFFLWLSDFGQRDQQRARGLPRRAAYRRHQVCRLRGEDGGGHRGKGGAARTHAL